MLGVTVWKIFGRQLLREPTISKLELAAVYHKLAIISFDNEDTLPLINYGIPTLTKLASSNIIWSNFSQIYGQTQICGQIVAYIWSKPNI